MGDYPSIIKKNVFGLFARLTIKRKKHGALALACIAIVAVSVLRPSEGQPTGYVHAEFDQFDDSAYVKSLMSASPKELLILDGSGQSLAIQPSDGAGKKGDSDRERLEKGLYEMVGDSPIREMVPFIAKRDQRVAAFLVGIAKKESSFGFASPSKNGKTCYNYWGYKGSAGRGTGMGYACFASAQEAVQVVGDRLDVLVEKKRDTPSRMVDTWKCGVSCAGDPGAPGWVSTVALYFNKIVNQNV